NIVDNALFYASSFYTASGAMQDQLGLRDAILARVRDLAHKNNLGVSIEDVVVQVIPPRQVRDAFERVSTAEIERRKARDDAQAYAGRILSTAQGEADAVVNQGR